MNDDEWVGGFHVYANDDELNWVIEYQLNGGVWVNRDLAPAPAFTTPEDFIDPQWKGKIVIHDPTTVSAGSGSVANMLATQGEEYVRKLLVDQEPLGIGKRRPDRQCVGLRVGLDVREGDLAVLVVHRSVRQLEPHDDALLGNTFAAHGQEDALVHWCETQGLKARPLALVGYGDQLAYSLDWCPAISIYQEAWNRRPSQQLEAKLAAARNGCASATAVPSGASWILPYASWREMMRISRDVFLTCSTTCGATSLGARTHMTVGGSEFCGRRVRSHSSDTITELPDWDSPGRLGRRSMALNESGCPPTSILSPFRASARRFQKLTSSRTDIAAPECRSCWAGCT